jgi:hypothetical protein
MDPLMQYGIPAGVGVLSGLAGAMIAAIVVVWNGNRRRSHEGTLAEEP